MRNEKIAIRLLDESVKGKLTWDKACQLAQAMEMVDKDMRGYGSEGVRDSNQCQVNRVRGSGGHCSNEPLMVAVIGVVSGAMQRNIMPRSVLIKIPSASGVTRSDIWHEHVMPHKFQVLACQHMVPEAEGSEVLVGENRVAVERTIWEVTVHLWIRMVKGNMNHWMQYILW